MEPDEDVKNLSYTVFKRPADGTPASPVGRMESLPCIACIRVIVGLMDSEALWF